MSAVLNHTPIRNVSWKGRTINQITSSIQKNKLSDGTISQKNTLRAMPLKIYRREIAVNMPTTTGCHNSRISSSYDELNRPGGYTITSANNSGLENTLESPKPAILNESYGCGAGAKNSYNCAEDNARRRCRSSGVIRRKYDSSRSETSYFTNTNQYLVSRSKTFLQNQYRHVRRADVSLVTNPLLIKDTYSPNGISHCPKASIIAGANVFYYYWLDASGVGSTQYAVTISPGNYDVRELNVAFESAMSANRHYFIYNYTHEKTFLMKIVYNHSNGCVEIQAFSSATVSNPAAYSVPLTATWARPLTDTVPVYYIPNTGIQSVIGFSTGYYPDLNANSTINQTAVSYGAISNMAHSVYPSYSIMYYKPSNNRFASQGGVSSSDMTERIKYETITRNGKLFAETLGSQVGAAMSYGVSDRVYSLKDKIGYPSKKTPVFDNTGKMRCLENGRYCASASNK
jgi:hypothetical protein